MSLLLCRPRSLPAEKLLEAAEKAKQLNPANAPSLHRLAAATPGLELTPQRIAMATKKYWGKAGVKLTVGFLDGAATDLRKRILLHMNAWGTRANVLFVASQTDPDVRIARVNAPPDDAGFWSYVGTDIRAIEPGQPTMNLENFTMKTRDSEFYRVVRHETGHTLGFEHEHLREELVHKIDPAKAIPYFKKWDGWSEADTRFQVLTPIKESTLTSSGPPDPHSIMCYDIPGEITFDGEPIVGGTDIDETDYAFAAAIYPKPKGGTGTRTKKKKKTSPRLAAKKPGSRKPVSRSKAKAARRKTR